MGSVLRCGRFSANCVALKFQDEDLGCSENYDPFFMISFRHQDLALVTSDEFGAAIYSGPRSYTSITD